MFSNYCECECDLMCAAKMSNLSLSDMFFHAPNAPKLVFGRVSAPDPVAGAYDAPPDSLVGGERHTVSQYPLHQSTPSASRSLRLRRLGCQAPNKFLAKPMCLIAA